MTAPRLGLTWRIFLASAGIVTLVLAVALVVASRSARRAAERSIDARLRVTQQRVQELVTTERSALANRVRAYADVADYRARVEAPTDSGDYLDYVEEAAEQMGAQWVQLISREGVRLAKSDDPSASRDTLLGSPLVRSALDGTASEAFGVASDSLLMHVVSKIGRAHV